MSDKLKSAFKWGLIGGLAFAVLVLLLYVLNKSSYMALMLSNIFILIIVTLAGSYEFRDKVLDGFVKFKTLLGQAMLLILVYGLLSSLWWLVHLYFIDLAIIPNILIEAETSLEAMGWEEERIMESMVVTKKMMSPFFFFLSNTARMLFFGLIISLPTCAYLKKEKSTELIIEEKLAE